MTTILNEDQYSKLKDIWKHRYPPTEKDLAKWISWLTSRNEEKDIKKLNETLSFLKESGIEFKDGFVKQFKSSINPNNILPRFSYCTIFNFLKTHNLISDEEIPIHNILNGVDKYYKKSRFHRENQIKFLLLFEPTEERVNKLLDFYSYIHTEYTIDLPEQKKIIKLFNQYASTFIKTLDDSKQANIFKKLDFICSGLNDESVKNINTQHEEEYSFRFITSVNNSINNASSTFNNLKNIVGAVVEKIKDEQISEILFKELNNQTKLGILKFQYAFFSKDKACIDKYSSYFKEFNELITHDVLSKNLGKSENYVEMFNKICFKNKLSDTLEVKSPSTFRKNKI